MNLNALIVVLLLFVKSGYGERTIDKMYELFNGRASCFRRLNATHQTGCSSKRDGSTGILHYVEAESDLTFILKNGNAGKYVPILPTHLLNSNTLDLLTDSTIVSGLVVYNATNDDSSVSHYSHERACPNSDSNAAGTCSVNWNPQGTGILDRDLPFPIYYIEDDKDVKKMRDCFAKFNNYSYDTQYMRSLCNIELDSFMYATGDTPTCLRRSKVMTNINPIKVCDPMGGQNIWASLFALRKEDKTIRKSYIIISARLDTTSMFNAMYPGAVSVLSGLVKLLATADLLKRMIGAQKIFERNVLFVLFNGETYDYIGSQRIVYDMENKEFPAIFDSSVKHPMPTIGLDNIELFVELSQLTMSDAIYVHKSNNQSPEIKKFIAKLSKYKGTLNVKADLPPSLPPSSAMSFLRSQANMSAIILADYSSTYTNKYFNSIYDNHTNLNYHYYNLSGSDEMQLPPNSIQQHTANFSKMLASTLYEEVIGTVYTGDAKPRIDLIDELFYCYLHDSECKIHQALLKKKFREAPHSIYSLYVGVTVSSNLLTYAIGLTLGWLTGDIYVPNDYCKNDPDMPMYQFFNMSESLDNLNTTVCYRTTMNFTEAMSPAFIIKDYDWSSGKYSSWSESIWKNLSVRMFLRPSPAHERFVLAIGCVTFIMSLILVYFIKSRSHILFVIPENCSPTSC